MTVCECCKGACCASDGSCTQEFKADCESAGGEWQGGATSCDDYDCTSGCCQEVTVDSCVVQACRRGYRASECDTECDPDLAQVPSSGVVNCDGGTPSSATVTGSGVTFNTGDPLLDADLDDCMNASYAIAFECDGTHDGSFTSTDFSVPGNNATYTVRVTLTFQSVRVASILVFDFNVIPPLLASMELNDGAATLLSSECGTVVYDCELFSGAPTSTGGAFGDYTSANIDVS